MISNYVSHLSILVCLSLQLFYMDTNCWTHCPYLSYISPLYKMSPSLPCTYVQTLDPSFFLWSQASGILSLLRNVNLHTYYNGHSINSIIVIAANLLVVNISISNCCVEQNVHLGLPVTSYGKILNELFGQPNKLLMFCLIGLKHKAVFNVISPAIGKD